MATIGDNGRQFSIVPCQGEQDKWNVIDERGEVVIAEVSNDAAWAYVDRRTTYKSWDSRRKDR